MDQRVNLVGLKATAAQTSMLGLGGDLHPWTDVTTWAIFSALLALKRVGVSDHDAVVQVLRLQGVNPV